LQFSDDVLDGPLHPLDDTTFPQLAQLGDLPHDVALVLRQVVCQGRELYHDHPADAAEERAGEDHDQHDGGHAPQPEPLQPLDDGIE
jgi:hypothetical protein